MPLCLDVSEIGEGGGGPPESPGLPGSEVGCSGAQGAKKVSVRPLCVWEAANGKRSIVVGRKADGRGQRKGSVWGREGKGSVIYLIIYK